MRAYYASKISENMARTPEGFLICYNVPIARTGIQEYLGSELGIGGELNNQFIPVHRYPDDVFSPAALASFEGKPATDDHPQETVRPDNISRYLKGVATNVRQGQGGDNDKVISDLIIYDSILISEIEAGKREVSCGYDCIYEQNEKGEFCQRNIKGNHVAIVGEGRAGSSVAIKDGIPNQKKTIEGSKKFMSKKRSNSNNSVASAIARLFPMFSKDAAPDEISDAVEALVDSITESHQDEETPAAAPQADNDSPATQDDENAALLKQIAASIQNLSTRIDNMEASKTTADDPLSKLEDELSGEESVTIPVEEMDNDGLLDEEPPQTDSDGETEAEDNEQTTDSDGVIAPQSDLPKNPISNTDRKTVLSEIKVIKPVIAQIKDAKTRKQVSDSLARVYRQSLGIGAVNKKASGYSGIISTKQMKAQQMDTKINKRTINDEQLGKDIAKKFNPHYKNK